MQMHMPTKEEFDALRLLLWNIFEIVLMLIAMVAVVALSLKHIPRSSLPTSGKPGPPPPG